LIEDRLFIDEKRFKSFRAADQKEDPFRRWFLSYKHFYEMPNSYIHRANINLASDLQYHTDFPDEFKGIEGEPALLNQLSLSQSTESTYKSVDTNYYVNLLKSNPVGDNSDAVHRFPEIRY